MIAEPQKVKSEKSRVAEICDWYTVELMVVVVGQEAGGVSEAAASCREQLQQLHMCPDSCFSATEGTPPRARAAWLGKMQKS